MKHASGYGCCVSSENVFSSFFFRPFISVTYGSVSSYLMNLFNSLHIILFENLAPFRITNIKSVMLISSRVLLRYKQSVKVIKTTFNKPIKIKNRSYLLVGISSNPISRNTSLNYFLTFIRGCRFPE